MKKTTRLLLTAALTAGPLLRAEETLDQFRIASTRDNFVWLQDGANARARKVAEGESPSLSPDGRRLAYLVSGDSDRTLHVMDCETARDTVLFTGALTGPAAWSPDGTRLAILIYDEERMGNAIHLADPAGSKHTKIPVRTPSFGGSAWYVQWLADGSGIGFHDMQTYFQIDTAGKVLRSAPLPDFAGVKNPDGRKRDSLSSSDGISACPADADRLVWTEDVSGSPAFTDALNGEPISALMTGSIDGSLKPRALTKKDLTAFAPVWSPGGEWIFFTGYTDAQAKEGFPFRIHAMRADGSELTMIARGTDVSIALLRGLAPSAPVDAPDKPAASAADMAAAQRLVNEGYALEQKGDIDAAVARYERAFELVPDPKLAKHMEELTAGDAEAKAQSAIAEGYQLERGGKLAEAAAKFREALKVVKDERVSQRLARIEAKLADKPAAEIAKADPVPAPVAPELPPAPAAPERPTMKPEAAPVPEAPPAVPAVRPVPVPEQPAARPENTPDKPAMKPEAAPVPDKPAEPVPDKPAEPQPENAKPTEPVPPPANESKVAPVAAGPGMWKQVKRYSEKSDAARHVTHKHDGYGHDSEYHKPDPSAPTGEISGLLATHFEMEDYNALDALKAGSEVTIGIYQSRHYMSPDDSKSRIVWVPADTKPGDLPKSGITVLKDVELPKPYGSKQQNATFKVPDGSVFPGGRALLRVEGVHHGEVSATTLLYEWVPEQK